MRMDRALNSDVYTTMILALEEGATAIVAA